MAVVKCVDCGLYIDDSEAVLVAVDDTHDATYCIGCAPDTEEDYDDNYDQE